MNAPLLRPFAALWQRWKRARAMEPLTDDLHAAWQERSQRPLLKQERELLENALVFSTLTAGKVCVPRSDIQAVQVNITLDKMVEAFQKSRLSRLLVYGESLDDVCGVITLKDIVALLKKRNGFRLAEHVHAPVFAPETMPIHRVLQLMRRHRVGMIVVTDEYGGTTGLLTLKDLLEELVGDIDDEHTVPPEEEIQSLGEGRFRVSATVELDDLNRSLNLHLLPPSTEIETIGGLVMHHARKVPAVGETVALEGGISAKVMTGNARRVEAIELQLPRPKAS